MKRFLLLILLVSLAYVPTVHAQCATGVDTGGQCVPPDALNPQGDTNPHARPRQPRVVWADRWGAIAIDQGTSSVGISENQTSKIGASTEAIQRCASKSNSQHCEISLAYYNQCAALAWGTYSDATAGALHVNEAQKLALQTCAKQAPDCKIVYSACSLPVRIQ